MALAQASGGVLCPPQKIAAGATHSLFVQTVMDRDSGGESRTASGHRGSKIMGWGGNRHNQLAQPGSRGSDGNWPSVVPTPVASEVLHSSHSSSHHEIPKQGAPAVPLKDFYELSCGGNFSLVLERIKGDNDTLTESHVWSFGLDSSGQLGRGADEQKRGQTVGEVAVPLPPGVSGRAVVQRVCCGTDHALAIVSFLGSSGSFASAQGRVFAWGLGNFGALGTKSRLDTVTPEEVWFPEDNYSNVPSERERNVVVKQVAAGFKHSLALADVQSSAGGVRSALGVIYAWGHGGNGRLGLGRHMVGDVESSSAEFEPKRVELASGSQIKCIAAGEAHSGAVDQLGGLHTWGQGSHGRLGHGFAMDIPTPQRVETLLGIAISQIAFGLMHTLATSVKGQLYACGKGAATGLDAGDNVAVATPRVVELPDQGNATVYQIATGPLHSLVLMTDGGIYFFGSGSGGRMVKEVASDEGVRLDQTFPKKLEGFKGFSPKETEKGSTADTKKASVFERPWWPKHIFCHGCNSVALTCSGSVWVWGAGVISSCGEGEAGLHVVGNEVERWEPAPVNRFLKSVVSIAIGLEHCLAITSDAVMYSWGEGSKGQLGTGSRKPTVNPQPITHPTDVISISAGEEHSACIIGGGESYTWGSADGGRVGQGSCLSEGVLLQPKQVAISDSKTDVLLRSVACGSQHTALISEDDRLLTFGTGWFGRLGHGNLHNQFEPKFVRGDFRVKDVYCAMYHTCVVDNNSMLWVFGRDTATCNDEHLLAPDLFRPFAEEPRRQIVSLAACDQHTLAVTRLANNPKAQTELWVWGKNGRGVLGVPEAGTPRINTPWLLRLPGFERDTKVEHEIVEVATAPHHSLALVKKRVKKGQHEVKKGQQEVEPPVVYAWGASTMGRLALATESKNSTPGEVERPLVEPPSLVEPGWKPMMEDALTNYPTHQVQASPEEVSGPSKTWLDVQLKLFYEDASYKIHKLQERAADVQKLYQGFLKDIMSLWDQPASGGDITEFNLRQKERELESQYVRNLKALDLGGSMSAPKLEGGRIQTDKDILVQMHYMEEMLWILQQQPCYLVNLCANLVGKREDEREVELIHRIIKQLFANMRASRNRNLFKSLLRLLGEREMTKANVIEEVFDPVKSRTPALLTTMCTNPHFMQSVAEPILDPDNDCSLVNLIIRYTISKDNEAGRRATGAKATGKGAAAAPPGLDFVMGVMASNQAEYQNVDAQDRMDRGVPPASDEALKKVRQVFQDQLKSFIQFVCPDEYDPKNLQQGGPVESLAHFIQHFIHNALGDESKEDCKDVQMMFVSAYTTILNQRYIVGFKSPDGEHYMPGICSPLSALMLAGVISGVLTALPGDVFSIVRMRIGQRVAAMLRAKAGKNVQVSQLEVDLLVKRVMWNIQSVARFLRRVVHRHVYEVQYPKYGTQDKEEKDLRLRAAMLTDLVNEQVFKVVQERPDRSRYYAQDTTETDLTVDMYTSHYSLKKECVWFQTCDLLELSNMLHMYLKSRHEDDPAGMSGDSAGEDRVCQLLREFLPKKKQGGGEEVSVPWEREGTVWIARQIGEWHNFTLRPRFLEYRNSDIHEPTFCNVSMAPIPRSLAPAQQKKRRGVRAVKPFRVNEEDRGPMIDVAGVGTDIYPFEYLETLLEELSGSNADSGANEGVRFVITGSTFLDLRASLEELQRRFSVEMDKGAKGGRNELLSKLEAAKSLIDKVRETHEERLLLLHIDRSVKRRMDYFDYLERIRIGAKKIEDAKQAYRNNLREEYLQLCHIVTATETCEIPDEIKAMAQQHSRNLAFTKAKYVRLKQRKSNPTPAQVILEQLVRTSPEGRITDELRAMVGTPARTFGFKELIKKGVVSRLNEKIPKNVMNQMKFVFQYADEGFTVQAFMGVTLLKEFKITREDIWHMESRKKNAVVPYGDNFIWFECAHLRRLLAWISAEGGP